MNKYKSDDYKLSAVKYYLNNNDSLDKVCKQTGLKTSKLYISNDFNTDFACVNKNTLSIYKFICGES